MKAAIGFDRVIQPELGKPSIRTHAAQPTADPVGCTFSRIDLHSRHKGRVQFETCPVLQENGFVFRQIDHDRRADRDGFIMRTTPLLVLIKTGNAQCLRCKWRAHQEGQGEAGQQAGTYHLGTFREEPDRGDRSTGCPDSHSIIRLLADIVTTPPAKAGGFSEHLRGSLPDGCLVAGPDPGSAKPGNDRKANLTAHLKARLASVVSASCQASYQASCNRINR